MTTGWSLADALPIADFLSEALGKVVPGMVSKAGVFPRPGWARVAPKDPRRAGACPNTAGLHPKTGRHRISG